MAGLAGFLSGTVSENLKKVVQPAGVVPATIFTLLNLAFIYPPAHAAHVGLADQFAGLTSGWQLAVITTVVFALGYLLVNASPSAVATLAGQTWRGSVLHDLLRLWQAHRRRRLSERASPLDAATPRVELASQFALETPGVAQVNIAPTRLGNVLLATQSQLFRRWGIDMTALWSQLESAPAVKDSPAVKTAEDEKATLQLMANLVVVSSAFALEAFAFDSLHHRWRAALAVLALLPVAYVWYRLAVTQARSWGDALEVAVDLHRDDLRTSLGMRPTTSALDARSLWRQASIFFRPDLDPPEPGDLFDVAPQPSAVAVASAGLEARLVVSEVDSTPKASAASPGTDWTLAEIHYLILASRVGVADDEPQTAVVVCDGRIKQATPPPSVSEGGVEAQATLASDGASLVWQIAGLDRGGAIPITYTLPLWTVEIVNGTAELADKGPAGLRFDLTAGGSDPISVRVTTRGPLAAPSLQVNGDTHSPRLTGTTFSWDLEPSTTRVWLTLPDLPA